MDTHFKNFHDELRRIAHQLMQQERMGHTLETNALIGDLYVRICASGLPDWADTPAAFLHIARRIMKQGLIGHARKHNAKKRGGNHARVALTSLDQLTGRGQGGVPTQGPPLRARIREILDAGVATGELSQAHAIVFTLRTMFAIPSAEVATLCEMPRRTVQHVCKALTAYVAAQLRNDA